MFDSKDNVVQKILHSYSNAAHEEMSILIKRSIWKRGIMTFNCFKVRVPTHVSGQLL